MTFSPIMLKIILLCSTLLMLSSCSNFETEIWIDKKGKGKMEMKFNPITFMPDELPFGDIGVDSIIDLGETQSEFDLALEKIVQDGKVQHYDTMFRDEDDDRFHYHFLGDTIKPDCFVKITAEFDNANDFNTLFEYSSLVREYYLKTGEETDFVFPGYYNKKKKLLRLPLMNFRRSMIDSLSGDEFGGDSAQKTVFTALLGQSVTKVHLPSRAVDTNDPEARLYGKTVVLRRSFFDLIDGKWYQREIYLE